MRPLVSPPSSSSRAERPARVRAPGSGGDADPAVSREREPELAGAGRELEPRVDDSRRAESTVRLSLGRQVSQREEIAVAARGGSRLLPEAFLASDHDAPVRLNGD